jgi:hypothetical protein
MFEVSLEIKDDKNDGKNLNLNDSINLVDSKSTGGNSKIDLNSNKKNQISINYEENKQDIIRIIIKNYIDYYYRNSTSINKYNIFKEIFNSSENYKNKNPEKEDFKTINKLFGISYEKTETNSNISINTSSVFSFIYFY